MECKCETCVRKDCVDRTKQDDLRIVIGCDEYLGHKMTNADLIRAMSNDELEAELLSIHLGRRPWCNFHCEHDGEYGCDKCVGRWLQQPAEDDK